MKFFNRFPHLHINNEEFPGYSQSLNGCTSCIPAPKQNRVKASLKLHKYDIRVKKCYGHLNINRVKDRETEADAHRVSQRRGRGRLKIIISSADSAAESN